ncbi:MAG: iron ABC transporter permease [Clostridia bacterium]|nr:iron ABC transporter permease [Clostridia bacterium]
MFMTKKTLLKSAYGEIGLMLILIFTCVLSLRLGSTELSFNEFIGALLNKKELSTERFILLYLRLPRILASVLAGAGLSASGVILQKVTGNELASPNIIGVNAGAGFSMMLMLYLFPAQIFLRPLGAFAGALLTTLIILTASYKGSFSKTTVILCGVAVTAVLNAGISFLSYLNPDILMDYNHFSVGGVSGVENKELIFPCVIICLCLITALLLSDKIDTLCLGDSLAFSLGVRVKELRIISLMLAGLSAAAVVSFAGLLGFAGLVVPHIARRLTDGRTEKMLAVAVPVGGTIVVLADLVGRTAFAPSEIPVGVVMSFIGAPFLLYIVLRRGKNA